MPSVAFALAGIFITLGLTPSACGAVEDATRHVLKSGSTHLGLAHDPEWRDLDHQPPDSASLKITFQANLNAHEATLLIRQREVSLKWPVILNGRKIGDLDLNETPTLHAITIPPGALHEGDNTLEIRSPEKADDIFVDDIVLDDRFPADALAEASVQVRVTEKGAGHVPVPCRLTMVDAQGYLAPLFVAGGAPLAVRTGVIYTGTGQAQVMLPAGNYTLYATRGFEYGLATSKLSLKTGENKEIALELTHEVPTSGLIACDTHVHSREFSGHGDATADERALTLAGEGIELAIGTDHNRFADYSDAARRMNVSSYFTTVVGDEVTTRVGHFNIFPVTNAHALQPDFMLMDWAKLVKSMRAVPGVQIVILNHPRDTYFNFIPCGLANFNPVTGESHMPFLFDAMEVANSGTPQSDFMQSYRDWFALLNHGHRITAIGSSDSHDVARFTVGQGRSYIAGDDHDPSRIDVAVACRSIKEGRVAVSAGLLVTMNVNGQFKPGDLATHLGEEVTVNTEVLGPSWVRAEKVELFANGVKIREAAITAPDAADVKAHLTWKIPKPAHDTYLVAIASSPGLSAPYWPIPFPHQPTNRVRHPKVIGSTNAIWLDADGDGKYTSSFDYARSLVDQSGGDPKQLLPALLTYDESVAAQAAGLCQALGHDVRSADFIAALSSASEATRHGFAAFIETLPKP